MKSLLSFLKSRMFLIQVGLGFFFVFLVIWITLGWLELYTNHGDSIRVPNFEKMSVKELTQKTEDLKLRFEVMDSAAYNPNFPKRAVVDQNPKPGKQVKENRKIYVTLNPSGYAKVSLPNVIQITRRSAIAKLSSVGLNVVDVEYIPEIGKEMVYHVKQNGRRIPPGTLIQKASDVVLVCGNGQR